MFLTSSPDVPAWSTQRTENCGDETALTYMEPEVVTAETEPWVRQNRYAGWLMPLACDAGGRANAWRSGGRQRRATGASVSGGMGLSGKHPVLDLLSPRHGIDSRGQYQHICMCIW